MSETIAWALLTGMITGGVWVGIELLRHRVPRAGSDPDQLANIHSALDQLENVDRRLAEVEERWISPSACSRAIRRRKSCRPPKEEGGESASEL